jgi:RNA polymerase sigma-70 factor (ECF subfamily)
MLHNFELSEDVVQEVFVHLWQLRNKLVIKTSMKSYLFSSVRNKAIEKLRRQKLDEKYRIETKETQSEIQDDPDDLQEKYLLIDRIYKSIDKLPDKCRIIFKMAKFDGMTYAEISDELGLSVKTIESQMRRAFIILREIVREE